MSKSTTTTPALPTVEAYLAGDRSARAKMRASLDAAMKSALGSGDLAGAMAANTRLEECKAAAGATPAKAEVNWTEVTRARIDTLRHAAYLLESGAVSIEGTPDEFTYEHDTEARPEPDEELSRKMATARATRSGPTHNVAEGIRLAFADEPEGTFLTIAEIGRRWVAAGGPANNSGRIAARLFADECTVTGVVPVQSTTDTPRGAKKVGDWSEA